MLILARESAVGVLGGHRVTLGNSDGRWWGGVAREVVAEGGEVLRRTEQRMHNRGGFFS